MSKKHLKLTKRLKAVRAKIAALYDECNSIEDILLDDGFKEDAHAIKIDNFKKKNVVYRTTSVRRWEFKIK